ncbi:MAG: hypothetical protein ACK559_23040, partial [bacterium]
HLIPNNPISKIWIKIRSIKIYWLEKTDKKFTEGKPMREIYIFLKICGKKIHLLQPIYLLILIVPLFSIPAYLVEKVQ